MSIPQNIPLNNPAKPEVDSVSYILYTSYKPEKAVLSIDFLSNIKAKTEPAEVLDLYRVSSVGTSAETNTETQVSRKQVKYSADWILITILLSLGILIVIKQLNANFIRKLIPAVFNANKGSALYTEYSKNPTKSLFFLGAISLINISIFIYQAGALFFPEVKLPVFQLISGIFIILLIMRFLHLSFSFISAQVFNILPVHNENRFNIRISNSFFGFILFPIILSIAYSPIPQTLVYLTILIYITLQIIRYGRLLRINFKNRINVLYLFLYLCTLEIIPVLVLITAVKKLLIS